MANDALADFGDLKFSGTLGWENNEIHRAVWLNDPANQLVPLLNYLFGTSQNPTPKSFGSPFQTFYAFGISFESSEKGSQGDLVTPGNFGNLLTAFPSIRGGIKVDIVFRPMDLYDGFEPIDDEAWDHSAQALSLIATNLAKNPASVTWSNGDPITNLSAIVKIIPKIEVLQKRIYVPNAPNLTQIGLIGSVNAGPLQLGASGGGNYYTWPAGTVLLVGLPTIRRWRFDGTMIFEVGIKTAINPYKAYCLDAGPSTYVTWNRVLRSDGPLHTGWDSILVGGQPLYPSVDLGQISKGI